MLQLTLLEKLKIIVDLILTSPFFIFLLIFSILVFVILIDSKHYDRKNLKRGILGAYIIIFVVALLKYYDSFIAIVDYFIDNLFVIFYFPNITVYAAMIVIANIIMLKTIFTKTDRVARTLNIAMYSLIMYLMLLVCIIISENALNIYDNLSLYTNSTILSLVEVSDTLFVIWILLLIINKLLDLLESRGLRIKSRLFPEKPNIITVQKEVYKEPITFTKEEYELMLRLLSRHSDKHDLQ